VKRQPLQYNEDKYSEYATQQRKRKKSYKGWREFEEGKNAQGEK